MSVARAAFLDRLLLLRACLQDPAVINGPPTDLLKNGVASVFRNGLAVLIYATAEAFIRERTAEILKSFDSMAVTFAALPEKLRSAVTIGALKGVLARTKYQRPADRVSWTISQLPPIASASVNVSVLSEFSFGYEFSNVSAEDVGKILSAFGIKDAWQCITNLTKRIGLGGIPDYESAFEDVAKSRHAAAHNVATHTAHGDLIASIDTVLGLCIGFDLLLSEACGRINLVIGNINAPLDTQIGLRFLTPHPSRPGHTREQVELTKTPQKLRTVTVHSDIAHARMAAVAHAQARRQHLVEWDASGKPLGWTTWR